MAHLDVIRGVTMLLVIALHVSIIDTYYGYWWRYLEFMRMPMFFFVSGFLMYSANFDRTTLVKRSKNRLYSQLWPTIVIFTLYVVFIFSLSGVNTLGQEFKDAIQHQFKRGYWFTYVLIEMFFVVAPTLYLFNRFRLSNKWRTVALLGFYVGVTIVLNLLMHSDSHFVAAMAGYILSLTLFKKYFIYFILGSIAKIYLPVFTSFYQKQHYGVAAVIFYCIIAVILSNFIHYAPYLEDFLIVICGCCGITAMLYLFHYLLQVKSTIVQRICSYLAIIGTSTLQIYLLHYFFQEVLRVPIQHIQAFINANLGDPFLLLFHIIFAIISAVACLLTVKVLKVVGVYRFIFPAKAKKLGAK